MVGLDAVVAFTDELERQLGAPRGAAAGGGRPTACDVVDRACRKLAIFLDELVNGAPPVPLKLFPEYEAMQRARGVQGRRADRPLLSRTCRRARRASRRAKPIAAEQARRRTSSSSAALYQRGLLAWLRGDDDGRDDDARRDRRHRGRHVAGAACARSGGRSARCSRRSIAGRPRRRLRRRSSSPRASTCRSAASSKAARRSPTGCAAKCSTTSRSARRSAPQVQAVQRAFRLSGLIPSAEVLDADVVRLQPLLREAREQLARRQGRVAQGRVGPRREPAEAQADAGVGAREGRRDPATAR